MTTSARRRMVLVATPAAAAWLLLAITAAGCGRDERRAERPPDPLDKDGTPHLEALGLQPFPGAKLAPGESAVRAPIPGGNAYLFRYRVKSQAGPVLDFYERQLRNSRRVKGTPPFIAGRTRYGDTVTVVPDSRTIVVKRKDKTVTTTYTEILITVRRILPPD